MPADRIIIGTRGSRLAMAQTRWVAEQIGAVCPGVGVEIVHIETTGDRRSTDAVPDIGSKGIFTAELEQALLAGRIDLAIHSAKDLPTETPPELDLLVVPPREDPRDALVSRGDVRLADLPAGAVIGTSSLRRQAQLRVARPDLRFVPLRGNVDTRIGKVARGDCDAAVLAMAGLRRASLEAHATEALDAAVVVPAPGQGTLAVQGRRDDDALRAKLAPLDDPNARTALRAERDILRRLEGGCRTPIGIWIRPGDGGWCGDAVVAMPDGSAIARAAMTRGDGDMNGLADAVVETLLAQGAVEIIRASRG